MSREKKLIVVPNIEFKAAVLPFGVITGVGVDNYEKTAKQYSVSAILNKKEEKALRVEVMDFWNEFKGKGTKEPANFKNIVRADGKAYFKTAVDFGEGKPNTINIVDGKRNPLDINEYGLFGGTSEGRLAVDLKIYSDGRGTPKGVSMFLSAVQLTKFEALAAGGSSAFGEEDGDAIASHGFEAPEPKKKKKKKKNKDA